MASTDVPGPGQSSWARVGKALARGTQSVRITAIGEIGGCNIGQMRSSAVDAASGIEP